MKIENTLDRRDFAKAMAVGLGVAALPALRAQQPPAQAPQGPKNIKIGLSTLAWNVSPNSIDNFEMALKDTSELGYWSFETVSPIIEAYDKDGRLAGLIEKYKVPMKAGYMGVNVTDPSVRKENIEKVIRIAQLVKKYGGNYVVIAVNGRSYLDLVKLVPGVVSTVSLATAGPGGRGRGPQGPIIAGWFIVIKS